MRRLVSAQGLSRNLKLAPARAKWQYLSFPFDSNVADEAER